MTHLLLTLSALVSVQPLATTPTLPEAAAIPLREVLSTDDALLDGRLSLESAMVEASTVRVGYANAKGGSGSITVILGHPSESKKGRRAGPFVILKSEGEDEAAVRALIKRLDRLKDEQIWAAKLGDEPEAKGASEAGARGAMSDADRRAARALWRGNKAITVGDTEGAKASFDSLSAEPELPAWAILDLAEGYRRIKALDEARQALERWKKATINDITSPVDTARYQALSGEEVEVLKVLQDARVSHNACGFDKLARSMDAVGNRTEAYLLLDSAARKTECIEVEATLLEWFVADGRLYEADQLSSVLTQLGSGNARIVAVQTMLLLGRGKTDAVLSLLKPMIASSPSTSLLSFFVGAQRERVPEEGGIDALGAKSDEDTADGALALTVAFAKHAEGDDEAAKRYLKRAKEALGDHRMVLSLEARIVFNKGDRMGVATILEQIDALDAPDVSSPLDAQIEGLRGELLRWTNPEKARDAFKASMLLAAKHGDAAGRLAKRSKARLSAMEECLKEKANTPCRGPFLYPKDHPANEAFDDSIEEGSGFGNWMMILGVLLLFMVIARQSKMNRQRTSRPSRWK